MTCNGIEIDLRSSGLGVELFSELLARGLVQVDDDNATAMNRRPID